MPPQYMYDAGPCPSLPTQPCRLSSRRSSSSLRSPSTSPVGFPRKRSRPNQASVPYQVMWTAVFLCLMLMCGLRWTTCHTVPSARNTQVEDSRWVDKSVVQVMQTRFMQDQPSLVDLGMARLEIFKSFCLPTMASQTSQDFLWIIRTDPLLNDTIKLPLLELLEPYPNFVLVASNSNPEGFRGAGAIADISPENVWSGSYGVIEDYHKAAQSRIVLESRLDADDGLHNSFVEYLEAVAPSYLPEPRSWVVWCAFSHLEWHYNSPFSSITDVEQGFLIGIKNSACVTSGLTMAYGLEATRDELPKGTHQFLHKVLPECSEDRHHECLKRFKELAPGAIRARTPTSAGMANVISDGKKQSVYKGAEPQARMQHAMWDGAQDIFHIDIQDAIFTRNYLLSHEAGIAADNLKGQCTKGHSCKHGAKKLLKSILEHAVADDSNAMA